MENFIQMTKYLIDTARWSALAILVSLCSWVYAQENTQTVSGRVVDELGRPLPGIGVQSENGKNGTSSDWEGSFSIGVSDGSTYLVFAGDDYRTQRVVLADAEEGMEIAMVKDNDRQDQLVELGYTRQLKQEMTGAVATVSGSVLERHPVANLSQTFAGRLAGLTTQETFSELSRANTSLYVRGISSARLNSPLVIIDGIPTSYNSSQSLEYISANEIESISVLKDASTQALYGIQSANGVIVVTTKRGRPGKVDINARIDQSIQQVTTRPVFYTAAEYAEMRNQAAFNDGIENPFTEEQLAHFRDRDLPDLYPSNDWYDRFMRDFASMQRVGVNVTGGNDRVTYFSNLNFMHQGGYFKTDQDRYNSNANNVWINYRSNVDMRFNDYLTGFVRLSGNIKRERTPGGASNADVYGSIFQLPPTLYGPTTPQVLDPETGEVLDPGGEVITTQAIDSPTYGLLNRTGYIRHTVTNITSQFGLDLDMSFLTKGLNLSGVFAYQTNSVGSLSTLQDFERYQRTNNWDVLEFNKKGGEQNTPLRYEKGHQYYYHLTYKAQLDYQRTFGNHQLSGLGYMFYQNLTKADVSSPELLPYNRVNTGIELNYGFANRYFIKAVTGYSASEQYARNHRYIFTPAVGASWLVSNERFMEGSKNWLSLLKIRGSWGKTGNDQSGLSRYAYLDNIRQASGGPLAYLQYLIIEEQTGNPLIQAEISTKTNLGLDLGLFNSFSLSVDVFKERMENMVVGATATVPTYQGVPLDNYPAVNAGIFENKGYEITLGYSKTVNPRLSFDVQGIFAYTKNKVIDVNEAMRTEDYAYRRREEGFPFGQEFGYLVDYSNGNGFFNSADEITQSGLAYGFGTPRVGDLKYRDLNGDGTIDERDLAPIGYGAIPRMTYSLSGGVRYGAFDLNVIFQGIGQYSSIIDGAGVWETEYDGLFGSLHRNAWTPERYENGETITWPALSTTKSVNHENSDFVNFDRSYLRLKNLEIGYTLSGARIKALRMNQIRFVLSGQNLITWDHMKTKDFGPEGDGFLSFPVYRVYSVGINVML
ncbi:MAG: SusC/RagA family TonB-linked outer membrane protein [Parapedobacter sp.]|nr:MAG: SusC/RagA family TonB-linked outer membrane protein [Parapedobacter sp.]